MGLFNIDRLKDDLEGYLETKISLLKLEINEQLIEAIAKIAIVLLIFILLCFGLLFLSTAAALRLNGVFQSNYLGFLVVGAFYFIVALSLWLFTNRNKISNKLSDKIRAALKQD